MSSSPDSFHNSFDSHETKQELDSPFLNEEYLVEEGRTGQTWRTPVAGFQLESPFFEAFEEGWGAIAEAEAEDVEEFEELEEDVYTTEKHFEFDLPPSSSITRDYSLRSIADGTLGNVPKDILAEILTKGNLDANALTSQVFWQRHPNLKNTQLDRTDPKQQKLRDERVFIFHHHIKPLIWLRPIIELLDKHRADIPREFLLGWMAVESDGQVTTKTKRPERGYFQIDWKAGEAQTQLKLNWKDFNRLTTDREFSIQMGVQLVQNYRRFLLNNYNLTDGTDLLWHLTKARHGASGTLKFAMDRLVKEGKDITWFAVSQKMSATSVGTMVVNNVNKMFRYAALLKPIADLIPLPLVPTPEMLIPSFEEGWRGIAEPEVEEFLDEFEEEAAIADYPTHEVEGLGTEVFSEFLGELDEEELEEEFEEDEMIADYSTYEVKATEPGVFSEFLDELNEEKLEQETEPHAGMTLKLPLVLAGPIVRRATTDAVWFWFACSKEVKGCTPSVTAYDRNGKVNPDFKEIILGLGELQVVRLGENIWIVLVSAVPASGTFPADTILGYELMISTEENGNIKTTKLADLNLKITYAPYIRPTFVIGKENRRLVHGSCRRPGGAGEDAFGVYDNLLSKNVGEPLQRPASLILTGDQIYADDVAVPLFEAVQRIAFDVFGYVEQVPKEDGVGLTSVDKYSWKNTPPLMPGTGSKAPPAPTLPTDFWSGRRKLTHRITSPIGFTTEDGEAHLLSFPEYATMYLAVWNPALCVAYGVEGGSVKELKGFCSAVQACRRVMANTATYMLCDDHEITDDWNLDQQWEDTTKKNPLARRIIANGLAAYWGFQAWGNDPAMYDKNFIQAIFLYLEQLRTSKGYPRNVGSRSPYNAAAKYEEILLKTHWSFMAASNPKALCVDTRTRRETPTGRSAILSGKRVWPYLDALIRRHGFRRGDTLLLVTPTPFLPHRSMMRIQDDMYSFPKDRYEGDFELYGNNPQQRAVLVFWLQYHFGPSALVIFSGDVHHGSVVSGLYAYSTKLEKLKYGKADWAMRIAQVTSSPIKNVKTDAYQKKRWWTLGQTDAGNVGESIVPQWEQQYTTTTTGEYIAMQAFVRKLSGGLGRETYIFENHLCVVDMPARPRENVEVLFVGVKSGKLQTAKVSIDTDNNPAKFKWM